MKETADILSRMGVALKAHKWVLACVIPATMVLTYAVLTLVPNRYTTRMVLAAETQRAAEERRVVTLNRPENFDLGIVRTDNPINRRGYAEVVKSPRLLLAIMDKPVSTLDNSYNGTLADYFCSAKKWEEKHGEDKQIAAEAKITRYQKAVLTKMRKTLSISLDQHTSLVTVEVTTKDPLVSVQMAEYIEEELRNYIAEYERDKMQVTLDNFATLTAQAEEAWKQAAQQGDAQASIRQQVYESFLRQQIVYQAQVSTLQPSICTLSDPEISYSPSSPRRGFLTLLMTLLVTIIMGGWYCRREIAELL